MNSSDNGQARPKGPANHPPEPGGGASHGQKGSSGGRKLPPQEPKSRRWKTRNAMLREEAAANNAKIKAAEKLHPGNSAKQWTVFWPEVNLDAARGRPRKVSDQTDQSYFETIGATLNVLKDHNARVNNLSDMTVKQGRMAFRAWEDAGLSPATLQQRYTVVRRFFAWIGQDNFPALSKLLQDPLRAKRTTSAISPKAWSALGVDPDAAIAEMEKVCEWTALHMAMQRHWGLRVQEALCFNVLEADKGDFLMVNNGTKGGRGRAVPLDTPLRRNLLEVVWEKARSNTHRVQYRASTTLAQARWHYEYMMRDRGFCKSIKGVTSHGLRHEYANDVFKEKTGQPVPVLGGQRMERNVEIAARTQLSHALGHNRPSITTAYTGTTQGVSAAATKRVVALAVRLEVASGTLARLYMAATDTARAAHHVFFLFILGDHATGVLRTGPEAPLQLGFQTYQRPVVSPSVPAEKVDQMERAIGRMAEQMVAAASDLTGLPVIVVPMAYVANLARFELFATEPDDRPAAA